MFSAFDQFDRLCAQFSAAIHASELEIYAATLALVMIAFLIFPPRNDPDQV
jgi:hypothetical protein